jgi:5-methylthioadenosine/S-adenosylhomocysteine deaminase
MPPARRSTSPFDAAYRRGVLEPVEPTPAATPDARETVRLTEAVPAEPFALAGTVLTPRESIRRGYVVVGSDGHIAAVESRKPSGVRVMDTGGIVMPGMLDLHGHPEFNVFAAWEPPRLFTNRYQWRQSELYQLLVRDPQNRLLSALPPQTQLRYAEVRALVGGVTAIQGASGRVRSSAESMVRNVDLQIFGAHRARSAIDLPSAGSRDLPRFQKVVEQIAAGEVTAFYVHLAEGRRDDPRSAREFSRLVELGGLTPATVIIHGCALSRENFEQVKAAGAKLVWSPQSNLRLYADTTDVKSALDAGVPVALGADWLPSGSTSLLAEMRVARRVLGQQGASVTADSMVRMVTTDAAAIAGLDDRLGSIEVGRPADLVVLERLAADPWESVLQSDPGAVDLVVIGGDLVYGRADLLSSLADPADPDRVARLEPLQAWGKPMLLDTRYRAGAGGSGSSATPEPRFADVRAALITQYPPVGPVFA